jgi:hypothetical protein
VSLGRWRPRWKWAAAALALGIGISLGLYLMPFAAYGIPSAERKPGSFEILALVRFLAQFLGSPVVPGGNERVLASVGGSLALAAVAGSVGIALACFVAIRVLWLRSRRSLGEAELFFVGVVVFALSAGVMTAVARGTDGPPWRALSSRYGMFCLLFWLAAVPLAAPEAAAAKAGVRRFAALVPIVVLLLLVPSQLVYLGWWMKWRSMVDGATASLVSGVPDPDYLAYIFPADRLQIVERAAPLLLREGLTPLHEIRARFIGQPVTKFGTPDGTCDARIVETKALSAGYRYSGTLTASGLPFDEQPVFITDAAGRVIGIGAVDRGWWWGLRGGLADRTRLWVAFAPRDRSGAAPVRIYASVGPRLCELGQGGGRR